MKQYKFTAICGAGLEKLVENEMKGFGGDQVRAETGCVFWSGELKTGYLGCLWSRYSSRILVEIASFEARNEDEVYNHVLTLNWDQIFSPTSGFAVSCTLSGNTKINHNHYTALRVKDAIVDWFRDQGKERPSVKKNRPGLQLQLHVQGPKATLYVDMSGESLHRRGYRKMGGEAPLKETLAAALVKLSDWPQTGGTLLDPMCGTGTLLIEAALLYGDSAPGLFRSYFGFLGWREHSETLWQQLVDEAMEREKKGNEKEWPLIIGYDCDHRAVAAARKNIRAAGLEERIHIQRQDFAHIAPPRKAGTMLSNLPFGERLLEDEVVVQLYRGIGKICSERLKGWRCALFLMKPEMTFHFNMSWEKKIRLFNGSLPCRLLVGSVEPENDQEFSWPSPSGEAKGDLVNRLRKNFKQREKWAAREDVSCFRLYDRDLPEYSFCVDIYSKWVHMQEYAPPKSISPEIAATRLQEGIRALRELFGIRSDRIFVKTRQRQRGSNQYQKKSEKKKLYTVREGGCSFLVNFTDYLDTGLFLDHRPLRARINAESKGKKFLNLYGYTASASVLAAAGGAAGTTTVDLSANYLLWARMNFALNGFGQTDHRFIQADCMEWFESCDERFDIIFIDPPTFSNTRKKQRVFDIQKDHLKLLERGLQLLEPGGKLYFSTNSRKFRFEGDSLSAKITDISGKTIPFDFRNQKIHKCWELIRR